MAIADLDLDAAILTAGEESYHVGSPHLGPSKISTYLKCPRQYEMTYILSGENGPIAWIRQPVEIQE